MKTNKLESKLHILLRDSGYAGRVVSARHIPDLSFDIRKHHDRGDIFPDLYDQYKSLFEFKPRADFSPINSLIIVAIPVPAHVVTFRLDNQEIPLIIPPTYLHGAKIIQETELIIQNFLAPHGFTATYARVPFKTLAVRSGLARYGRNNISYIHNMGSFFRLCAFYSNLPPEQDIWYELTTMDLCKNCVACQRACPTRAIYEKRFLLRVERCLTYHNEQPGEIPFPSWIQPEWHNCLVGCLYCQKVCPANKKVINWMEKGPDFSEEETALLMNSATFEELPEQAKKKLRESELDEYLEVFARNAQALLNISSS